MPPRVTIRPHSRVVRIGWTILGLGLIVVGTAAIGWLSAGSAGLGGYFVGMIAVGVLLLGYVARVRVLLAERGVRVINPWSTYSVAWDCILDVEIFEVGSMEGPWFHRLALVTTEGRIKAAGTSVSPRRSAQLRQRVIAYGEGVRPGRGGEVSRRGLKPLVEARWNRAWGALPASARRTLVIATTAAALALGLLSQFLGWGD